MLPYYAILYYGQTQIRLSGSVEQGIPDGLGIAKAGIEGWLSAPDLKVDLTQRANGDGAHDIASSDIQYAERTVTVHWIAMGDSRDETLAAAMKLSAAAHQTVRLRVVDSLSDTYVTGYVRPEIDAAWHDGIMTGTLTIVCYRPERLSWQNRETQLYPVSSVSGGLSYGPAGKGLDYGLNGLGLSYGVTAGDQRNIGMLRNEGTSRAYPVLTVNGEFPDGLMLIVDGQQLGYDSHINATPLVIDSRSGGAYMGGVDVGRWITGGNFPIIPPKGSVSVMLASSGSGWVTCDVRDTYM
ncbi:MULTISPECIES: hypothetical protein [Bifidobacterium]|uniref:Phage tail protein n=1 Tax=Bifidobacterium tibiigranuli TaxID=2172043 RepID=A0A5N6S734_9BIFI|nr:hypothetical protein [Bifidobacterium tibiigranuli]KAE8130209.1 hypothetical protein DDE84_01125 [Bifidobacterium tibiigranuli]KAE8130432.1 hypothetical protein DDF78_00530 [Bifidobacterium tibiigranuli]